MNIFSDYAKQQQQQQQQKQQIQLAKTTKLFRSHDYAYDPLYTVSSKKSLNKAASIARMETLTKLPKFNNISVKIDIYIVLNINMSIYNVKMI